MAESGFSYIDHTADAEFRAWAPTLTGAFEQAALAMLSLVCDMSKVRHAHEHAIEVKANNEEELLFSFLAELVFIQDSKGMLLGEVFVNSVEDDGDGLVLRGKASGEPYDEERHTMLGGVKAPTYHNLTVNHHDDTVEVHVLVDT